MIDFENATDFKKNLKKLKKDDLMAIIFNSTYNEFIREWALEDAGLTWNGKLVPYMGWHWRDCDFYHNSWNGVSFGFDGKYVGVMQSNEWDYHERKATDEELKRMLGYIDAAMEAANKWGDLNERHDECRMVLLEMNAWIQTLPL